MVLDFVQVYQTWCQMESSCEQAVVLQTMLLLRSFQEGNVFFPLLDIHFGHICILLVC